MTRLKMDCTLTYTLRSRSDLLEDLHNAIHINDKDDALGSLISPEDIANSLSRLQKAGVLPYEQPELNQAIFLIERCLFIFCSEWSNEFDTSLVLTTIQHAKEKGWGTLYKEYIKLTDQDCQDKHDIKDIQDTIVDYIKSLFGPKFFRGVSELGPEHPLYRIFTKGPEPELDPNDMEGYFRYHAQDKWLENNSPIFQLAEVLCKGKDIVDLAAFSKHWHAPLQLTVFQKFKSSNSDPWPSLFQSQEEALRKESHKELEIPKFVISKNGWKFIARTSHEELIEEGKRLSHCVAGYTSKCQRENTHIISIVDEEGHSLSTIELVITTNLDTGQKSIQSCQHRGYENGSPSEREVDAHNWLLSSLNNGTIPVDFNHLENAQRQLGSASKIFESTIHEFIQFNPFGTAGLIETNKIRRIYLEHTPANFTDNLKELFKLTKVQMENLTIDGNEYESFEVDLLSKEELKSTLGRKKERASRWNPSKWSAAKTEEAAMLAEAKTNKITAGIT